MNNQKEGEHYVVDGAIFKCQQGAIPCQISVVSQPKVTAENKAMVNDGDVTFASPTAPFATCKLNMTPNGPGPCTYSNAKWKPNTLLPHGSMSAVVESSTMICPIGGEISCVYHGQTQCVTAQDFKKVGLEGLALFPLVFVYTIPTNYTKKASSINSISVSKNIVRQNETITLHAYKEAKQKSGLKSTDVVNWIATTRKEVEEDLSSNKKGGTYLDRVMIFKHVWSPYNLRFNEPGTYYIEGGSDGLFKSYGSIKTDFPLPRTPKKVITPPFYDGCWAKVEVLEHNRILSVDLEDSTKKVVNYECISDDQVECYASKSQVARLNDTFNKTIDLSKVGAPKVALPANNTPKHILSSKDNSSSRDSRDKHANYANVERYVHSNTEDLEIVVRTAVPLVDNEQFYLVVNGFVNYDWTPKKTNSDTEYRIVLEPQSINANLDVDVVLTESSDLLKLSGRKQIYKFKPEIGVAGIVDVKPLKIKQVGLVDASICLDCNKGPVPEMVRPGTKVILQVSPKNHDRGLDLSRVVWTIKDAKTAKKSKPTYDAFLIGDRHEFTFDKEGSVEIKLSLSDCSACIGDIGQMNYKHLLNVSKCLPMKLDTTRTVFYPGIKYRIGLVFNYDDYNYAKDPSIFYKQDGRDIMIYGKEVELKFDKTGKQTVGFYEHELFFNKTASGNLERKWQDNKLWDYKFTIENPAVKMWQFSDDKHNRIDEVGLEETFYFETKIPAWADLENPDLLKKVCVMLWNKNAVNTTLYKKVTLENAKFSDDGTISIGLNFSRKELEDRFGTQMPEKVSLVASISNIPDLPLENVSKLDENQDIWFYNNAIPLTLVTQPCVTGFFSGKSGNPQKSVMKYGDSMYIMLAAHNLKGKYGDLTVKVYENNKIGDDPEIMSFKKGDAEFELDEEKCKIKIDLSKEFADDTKHGDNPNPRLFYFRVYLDGKQIYTYPQSPADVYNMTYKEAEGKSETAEVEIDGESYSMSKSDDSCDYESALKIRSYLWQLKVGKDKEIERLNRTLAMMAPVVVGEELRKGEKNNEEDCKCPRCHEEWEDLAKRLKKIFPNAKEEDRNIVAETYCKYARRFGMDSCWIKAHFFAQVAIETKGLTEFKESLNYSANNLYNGIPYFNHFKGNIAECKKYGRVSKNLDKNGKYIDWPGDGIPTEKDFHPAKQEEIAKIVHVGRNGNENAKEACDYIGRGLIQLTGKKTYKDVGKILECFGMNKAPHNFECDLVNNFELVAADLKLATVTAMAFFRFKGCNMHVSCDGKESVDDITRNVNPGEGSDGKQKRRDAFHGVGSKKGTKEIFEVKECQYNVIECSDDCPSYHTFFCGRVEKHIPKGCDESKATHYIYYYHKEDGTVVEICKRTIVRDENLVELSSPTAVKKDFVDKLKDIKLTWDYSASNKIEGQRIYVLNNGSKVVVPKPGKTTPCYIYNKIGKEIELVKIDENCKDGLFEFNNNDGVNLYYRIKTDQTDRFYCNPNTFAILIGILAELGANPDYDIKFEGTGNAEIHGTGYPSVTHVNGMSLDFSYSEDADAEVRKNKDIALLKAGIKFNCMTRIVGFRSDRREGREAYSTPKKEKTEKAHNDHIHLGPFNDEINEPTKIEEK